MARQPLPTDEVSQQSMRHELAIGYSKQFPQSYRLLKYQVGAAGVRRFSGLEAPSFFLGFFLGALFLEGLDGFLPGLFSLVQAFAHTVHSYARGDWVRRLHATGGFALAGLRSQ